MITLALYDYLTHEADLTSRADTELFASPLSVGSLVVRNRNDARKYLRGRLGKRIYNGRNPDDSGQSALLLRQVAGQPEYHLRGEYCRDAVIQADVLTRSHNATIENEVIATLLQMAVTAYRGVWSTRHPTNVYSVQVIRSNDIPTSPKGGEVLWTHRKSIDLSIKYDFARAEMPVAKLSTTALIDYANNVLRVIAVPLVPVGRTLTNCSWVITDGTDTVTFGGAPDLPSPVVNVAGLNADAAIDTVAASLNGTITSTLTVTDSNGDTAQSVDTITI